MVKKILAGLVVTAVFLAVLICAAQGQDQLVDKHGRVLTKMTFIHFKKDPAKPAGGGGGKGGGGTDTGSYTYLAKGAKWKGVEAVYVNPANGESATTAKTDVVMDAVTLGVAEWETPGTATFDIIGDIQQAAVGPDDKPIAYDGGKQRGYNTISFGSYSNSNVIAVTSVWGIFGGPIEGRGIFEAHILMNDAYDWGDATKDVDPKDGSPDHVMDLQNILTHELGHWVGMGDLYQGGAIQETMYGYSTEGETKKRDLYKGDITGVTNLYK